MAYLSENTFLTIAGTMRIVATTKATTRLKFSIKKNINKEITPTKIPTSMNKNIFLLLI